MIMTLRFTFWTWRNHGLISVWLVCIGIVQISWRLYCLLFHLHIGFTSGYLRLWTSQRWFLLNAPAGLRENKMDLVWQQFNASLSAKYNSFWRRAAGCLRTRRGDISRWNIPGAKPTCVHCDDRLETVSHMFMTCRAYKGPACHLWAAVVRAFIFEVLKSRFFTHVRPFLKIL